MGGSGDNHTKSGKSDRERQVSHYITYMWNLDYDYKWTYLQNRNRFTNLENQLMVTWGKSWGRDRPGAWNWHVHSAIFRTDSQ